MTCTVRHALASDAVAACEVVRRSIVELCHSDHQGVPDTLAKWLANKTPANFERWVTSSQHIALVGEIGSTVVGFGLLNRQGTIALLYVSPDARFRGVSKSVLAALEREAIVAGVTELKLESSLTALRFYTGLGYVQSGPPCHGFGVTTCYPMSRRITKICSPDDNRVVAPMTRRPDGSAGDVDYGAISHGYVSRRRPEPRIMAAIERALGPAQTVLNVGAGGGSYEPLGREVVAVEPSASMRAQRPKHLSAAIDAVAEELPFDDRRFDASIATFTVHQWANLERGLAEMRRVTNGAVIILTCDPTLVQRYWLNEYAPKVLAAEARRYPSLERIRAQLRGTVQELSVPIPFDCCDGFNEAYYGRPENFLEDGARLACSAWTFVDARTREGYIDHLRRDLASGGWDARYGHLRTLPEFNGSLRLVVAT